MRKRDNLSSSGGKTVKKFLNIQAHESINQSSQIFDSGREGHTKEKIIRKSYALTKQDIAHLEQIKDKCLDRKVVLNDSHIVRIALMLASKLTESSLIRASLEVPKLITGRPKNCK